jgi:type IV pilus assembly protein PilQ
VSIDVQDISLNDLLKYFGSTFGLMYIFDRSVKGEEYRITVKVDSEPWNKVIETVLLSQNLTYRRIGNVTHIITSEALTAREKAEREQKRAELLNSPRKTAYFKINHALGGTQVGVQATGGNIGGGAAGGNVGGGSLQNAGTGNAGGAAGAAGTGGLITIVRNNLTEAGVIDVDPRTNTLIVTDVEAGIRQAGEVIKALDIPQPQVEIEARIVIANRNYTRDLGFLLNGGFTTAQGTAGGGGTAPYPTGRPANSGFVGPAPSGTIGGVANTAFNLFNRLGTGYLSSTLTANEQRGIVRTISAPRLVVQNNMRGQVIRGTLVPFIFAQGIGNGAVTTTTFQNANLGLNVTPRVAGNSIYLTISVSNDTVDRSISTNQQPSINQAQIQTEVLCEDGGSLLLSGIISEDEFNQYNNTPGLGKIPILKYFFTRNNKSRSQAELLFFITARVLPSGSFGEIVPRPEGITTPNVPENVTPALPSADMPPQSKGQQPVERVVPALPSVPNTKIKPAEPKKEGEKPKPTGGGTQ